MKLPELPKKNRVQTHGYNTTTAYTAQQLRDYGHECAEAMRDACAEAAEESPYPDGGDIADEVIKKLEIEG